MNNQTIVMKILTDFESHLIEQDASLLTTHITSPPASTIWSWLWRNSENKGETQMRHKIIAAEGKSAANQWDAGMAFIHLDCSTNPNRILFCDTKGYSAKVSVG